MRKLLDTVQNLFESYDFKDQLYDRFNDCLSDYGHIPEVRALLDQADAAWAGKAPGDAMDLIKQAEKLGAQLTNGITEELSQDQIVDYIEELKEIMLKLQDLGDHATSIVSEIDPGEAQRLEAYGAFDFGTSSNQYDTTLASFIEDLESGQYDSMSESKEEACPNCGKQKHVLKACASCGCS